MGDTIFAKIICREIPAEIIYENDTTLAFLDIKPVNPGHTLVIPKRWSKNVLAISADDWAEVMETVRILAPAIVRAVGAEGINIMMNNESAAGQLVFHSHVHLIPRFEGDGFEHWPGTPYEEGVMVHTAESIRTALVSSTP